MPPSTDTYRIYLMVLVVGLFAASGVGYVVGANSAREMHVIDTSPYPKNYDVTKANAELLKQCYDYMNNQVITLREMSYKTETDLRAAIAAAAKVCDGKKTTH